MKYTKYASVLYDLVEQTLSERRQRALLGWQDNRLKLAEKYPEIAEQRKQLHKAQAQLAMKACDTVADLTGEQQSLRRWHHQVEKMIAEAQVPPEYLAPLHTCPSCKDTGKVNGQTCTCKEALLKELAYRDLSDRSNVSQSGFDQFALGLYPANEQLRMSKVLRSCQQYASRFKPPAQNLLFWGSTGLGKTHLSLAIAEEVVRKGYLVLYASVPHLMGQMEQQQFAPTARSAEYRRTVYSCDLLIMDDLGTEFGTRFTEAEVYDIINTRINEHRPTIINTNLDMRTLRAQYGERVASRLQGCFSAVHFVGADIRLKLAETTRRT